VSSRLRYVVLQFDPSLDALPSGKSLSDGMSAVTAVGDALWLAHDETVHLERLSVAKPGQASMRFTHHRRFDLCGLIAMPAAQRARRGAPTPEADLEGIAFRDGYLWVAGSHSVLRDGAKGRSAAEAIAALAGVQAAGNRFLLARIPVQRTRGECVPVKEYVRPDGTRLKAATLRGGREGDALTAALRHDAHLAPFMSIPSKDNGFDIEGIAAAPGGRLFLGLRGPVIDGWACILEVRIDGGLDRNGHLKLCRLRGQRGRKSRNDVYRKHFLDLGGAGIRDLCLVDGDLLILSGPPMRGKGRAEVLRWKNATAVTTEHLVKRAQLPVLLDLPYAKKTNHAEGIAVLTDGGHRQLLVIYDSAKKDRRLRAGAMKATLHRIPAIV
jgi:hypothetical protein